MKMQDITEYQVLLAREIASRLDAKCDKLADAIVIEDIGQFMLSFHSGL